VKASDVLTNSLCMIFSRLYSNDRAIGTVLRPSVVVCTKCIVAKRCVLEQKLPLRAHRIWEIDWY